MDPLVHVMVVPAEDMTKSYKRYNLSLGFRSSLTSKALKSYLFIK